MAKKQAAKKAAKNGPSEAQRQVLERAATEISGRLQAALRPLIEDLAAMGVRVKKLKSGQYSVTGGGVYAAHADQRMALINWSNAARRALIRKV